MKNEQDFKKDEKLALIVSEIPVIKSAVLGIEINSPETQAKAAGFIIKLKGFKKQIGVLQKAWTTPFKDVIAVANEFAKSKIEPIDKLLGIITPPYLEYQKELDRIARDKEIKRLQDQAKKDKEIADLKAKEGKAKTDKAQEKIQEKIEVAENAPVAAPAKEKPTVKTESGSVSTSKRWTYEVENIAELDPEYLLPPQPDRGKLQKAVNDGVREIKGVKIFQKTILGGRYSG